MLVDNGTIIGFMLIKYRKQIKYSDWTKISHYNKIIEIKKLKCLNIGFRSHHAIAQKVSLANRKIDHF